MPAEGHAWAKTVRGTGPIGSLRPGPSAPLFPRRGVPSAHRRTRRPVARCRLRVSPQRRPMTPGGHVFNGIRAVMVFAEDPEASARWWAGVLEAEVHVDVDEQS